MSSRFLKKKKEKLGCELKKDVKPRKTIVGFQWTMPVNICELMKTILCSRADICRR